MVAIAIAQLIRHQMRYERPWAHLFGLQDGDSLNVRVTFIRDPGDEHREPVVYLDGEQLELGTRTYIDDLGFERHSHELDPIALDLDKPPDDPLLDLLVAWVPTTSPIWDIGTHLTDNRLYSRHTFDAVMPNVTLQILRWSSDQQ